MINDIKADAFRISGKTSLGEVLVLALKCRTYRAVFTLRLCQHSATHGRLIRLAARLLHHWTQAKAGIDLPSALQVGPGLCIEHGWGLVVSSGAQIGSNVTLYNGVLIGRKDTITTIGRAAAFPIIESDVWIGAHAIIVGGVRIGQGAVVGPGSVVTKDVPAHCVVVGNPARILRRNVQPDVFNRATISAPQGLPAVGRRSTSLTSS